MLCGFERRACKHRGCEAGLKHWGWVCAFWLVLFGHAFSGSFFWVRSFGRSFRGSFFGFVLWVVLFVVRSLGSCFLVVLFVVRSSVRAFGRSFRGSFFCSFFWSFFLWFVLLVRAFGGLYVFLFDALKVLEACVARSEVS